MGEIVSWGFSHGYLIVLRGANIKEVLDYRFCTPDRSNFWENGNPDDWGPDYRTWGAEHHDLILRSHFTILVGYSLIEGLQIFPLGTTSWIGGCFRFSKEISWEDCGEKTQMAIFSELEYWEDKADWFTELYKPADNACFSWHPSSAEIEILCPHKFWLPYLQVMRRSVLDLLPIAVTIGTQFSHCQTIFSLTTPHSLWYFPLCNFTDST